MPTTVSTAAAATQPAAAILPVRVNMPSTLADTGRIRVGAGVGLPPLPPR